MAFINKVNKIIRSINMLIASTFIRRDPHYVALGSWLGKLYADNSKYLLEYMLSHLDTNYRFIWVGEKKVAKDLPEDERVIFAEIGTKKTNKLLLKCKYMFCSQHVYNDICMDNVYKGAIVTYLHHGFPIKKWGADALQEQDDKKISIIESLYQKVLPFKHKYDYFAVSSQTQGEHFLTALGDRGCEQCKLIYSGTPRNDLFFTITPSKNAKLKEKYASLLGFSPDKKLVLYLPTYRRKTSKTESLYITNGSINAEIQKILSDSSAVLLEKKHFVEGNTLKSGNTDCFINITQSIDVQELMACVDVLVSDYSGAFVDYLLLDRPIIHYIYDYDEYKNIDSGLYYDVDTFRCGDVAYTYDQLLTALQKVLLGKDSHSKLRAKRRSYFLGCETGCASKTIIDTVMLKKNGD